MANEVQIVLTAVDKASATLKKVGTSGGVSMKALGIGLTAAFGAASSVAIALKKTADEAVAYNIQIRNLAQNLGITTEETSRLVQAADDFAISQETITSALQMAVKKGFAPNINTVAQLADEYNSIEDPVKRAARMVEVFGKNWTALTPMLREGGDAIREAYDNVEDGFIVTEKSAKAARDYQISVDKLTDTFGSLKMMVGNEVIPVLTDGIDLMNDWISATQEHTDAFKILDDALANGIITQEKYNELVLITGKGTKILRDANVDLTVYQQGLTDLYQRSIPIITDYKVQMSDLTDAEEAAKEAADRTASAYSMAISALEASNVPLAEKNRLLDELAIKSGKTTAAEIEMQRQINILTLAYQAGAIKERDYDKALDDIAAGMPYAISTAGSLASGYHNVASGASAAAIKARELARAIAEIKDKTVTITVKTVKKGSALGGDYGATGATGLDMTVPPGYPGDSFPVWTTSGEHVTVTPQGETSKGSGGSGTTNNFYIQSQDVHGVAQEVAALLSRQSRRATYSGLQYSG
jgi:hypothetical protein